MTYIIQKTVRRYFKQTSGATAIEYALIAGLLAMVILVGITTLGGETGSRWDSVAEDVSTS